MKKRLSLMILTILILQLLLPLVTIIWESGFTIKSIAATTYEATDSNGITWTYELQNNQAVKVKPKDKTTLPTDVIIPSILNGYTVTSIGTNAFFNCRNVISITIPASIINIERYVFLGCGNLTSISVGENNQNYSSVEGILFNKDKTELIEYPAKKENTEYIIPSTVISIEEKAFDDCIFLTSIEIPEGVTNIEVNAFAHCRNLASITMPDSITNIGNFAFVGCSSLESIQIPEKVTNIGVGVFSHCNNLTNISVEENNQNYSSAEGILFNKDKTELIKYPEGKENTEYVIPSTVISLGDNAFENSGNLINIEITECVTNIGDSVFDECVSLTSVEIPASVRSIGNHAFNYCLSLTSISVDENNQNYSSVDSILFNKDKTELIKYPEGKENTEYIIPSTVISIGEKAFVYSGNLVSITIPNSVQSIGRNAFYDCSTILKIYCKSNSVAETYAKDNNKAYVIDDDAPIVSVENNPNGWTKESVTLTVNAEDSSSGLAEEAYSFDGGATWQKENTKTYENYENIVIKVRDNLGNIAAHNVEVQIDKEVPTITSIEGNPTEWTKESVTLTVNAEDSLSGLTEEAYSFDGGTTWQKENTKTYVENTNGIVVKVRDSIGNIVTYEEEINITKIMKLEKIEVEVAPNKTEYAEGQVFDKTGMKVIATYNNGYTEEITEYTISPERELTKEDNKITISYTEKGITKETTQDITVIAKGDVNGDNEVNFMDILLINKYRLGKTQLEGIYIEAADVTGEGEVNFRDILRINKYRLGKINSL